MNLLVLEPSELGAPLPRSDRRVEHVRKILKKGVGDSLAAGIAGDEGGSCPLGTARVESWDGRAMVFSFRAEREAPPLRPVELILGFPRPIQANRILKDLASLGVRAIRMAATELGEKSYADSTIFREREFRRPLLEGAEQAGNPRLPAVSTYSSLAECLAALPPPASVEERWALDPYRSECRLGGVFGAGRAIPESVLLAVGSERGWTDRELDSLAEKGFRFASLGDRILRTETACTAAVVLALAGRGII